MSASRNKSPTPVSKPKSPLPLHLVEAKGKLKRGGPRDVTPKPVPSQVEYEAAVAKGHDRAVENDLLVGAIARRDRPADIAHQTLVEMARAAASIKWDRQQAIRKGRYEAAAKLSSRRLRALRQVTDLIVQQHRAMGDGGAGRDRFHARAGPPEHYRWGESRPR